MILPSLAVGDATDSLRVLGREVVLPRRPLGREAMLPRRAACSFAAVRRGFLSLFGAVGREVGCLGGVRDRGGEGARSLIGLISSRLGRIGDPILLMELRPGMFFHFVEDVEVIIGDGFGGLGFPELVTAVCCADAGYGSGPEGAGRGVCG